MLLPLSLLFLCFLLYVFFFLNSVFRSHLNDLNVSSWLNKVTTVVNTSIPPNLKKCRLIVIYISYIMEQSNILKLSVWARHLCATQKAVACINNAIAHGIFSNTNWALQPCCSVQKVCCVLGTVWVQFFIVKKLLKYLYFSLYDSTHKKSWF